MKSLWNRLAVLSVVPVLALLAGSTTANAQNLVTGQTVKTLKIERVLQLNNILTTITPVAPANILAALAGGALEIREQLTFNPIANAVNSVIFLVPTGTPFPTPAAVDVLGNAVATYILAPDRTYVTANSVMFSGIFYISSNTPYGNYTGAPGVISFGFTNDTPPKITNVVDLIAGAVVAWSASGTGTFTLSTAPVVTPPGPSNVTVTVTPASQQVTSPLAHIDAKATDSSDASATFTYQWTALTNAPSVNIINPNSASVDLQLGSFFNSYVIQVKATNTKTGQSATATATIQCVCADHF